MDHAAYARDLERDWNSPDPDLIPSHCRDDIVFRSRRALALAGQGEIVGLDALRACWQAAPERQPERHFEVVDVFAGHEMMVIAYRKDRGVPAAETLYFDAAGRGCRAVACHRAGPA